MTVKKSAGTKKTAAAARHATPEHTAPQDAAAPEPMTQDAAPTKAEPVKVWALPVAMLMLVVAAAGLWMAVRESSNTSQAATPAVEATLAPERKAPKPAATTAAAPAASNEAKPADAPDTKVVSVTGCLQQADRGFVLKDTEGTDAPKSRSWKSGFMRRSNSAIALSDAKSSTRFAEHVGERVTVTGPMSDRAMRVTSMKRIAATCE